MTTTQIMTAIKGIDELGEGEAMYYLPQTDEVVIGRNGCQPSNSLCLRVGPDSLDNLSMTDIEDAVAEYVERN